MYCKHCGQQIDDNAKFCQHCGGTVSAQDPACAVPVGKKKKPLIVGIAIVCVVFIVAFCVVAKQSADRKREEEALAASIAESESIAASIAEAEAIAESIAQEEAIAESIANEEVKKTAQERKDYIDKLNRFIELTAIGHDTSAEICGLVYMVWFDTNYEQYREETAEFTMTDGVYHEYISTSIDALRNDFEFVQTLNRHSENRSEVAAAYQLLANPPAGFDDHYAAAGELLDAYVAFWNFAITNPFGSLENYYDSCIKYSANFSESIEKLLMLMPES